MRWEDLFMLYLNTRQGDLFFCLVNKLIASSEVCVEFSVLIIPFSWPELLSVEEAY